jgi:SAGA-associated factor 73
VQSLIIVAVSNESTSPTKKRLKVPIDDNDSTVSTKGLKKSEIKKIQKEQLRLEKKAAKEQEKAAIAERKRQRGELIAHHLRVTYTDQG